MRIGVLGGGQLARMLAQAGQELGHTFTFLDPSPTACAAAFGDLITGSYTDASLLTQLADVSDVVTYEFENVPVETVRLMESLKPVHPSGRVLTVTQDRLPEKMLCRELGLGTADFYPVDSLGALKEILESVPKPAILKTRREGYDGKGQVLIAGEADIATAQELVTGKLCILEAMAPFSRELSIIAVRNTERQCAFYPLVENEHRRGILYRSRAPADVSDALQKQAEHIATALLNHFDYVGVMAVELFDVNGTLLVNEIAPRVHNSGHWTIDGAETSQFTNHLLAITGMAPGSTSARGHSIMHNLLGEIPETLRDISRAGVYLHDYDKEPRPGRKVGHITVTGETFAECERMLDDLLPSA